MKRNWEYKKLGEVCTIERGGSPRPIEKFITDDPNGLNWIKIGDAVEGSKYITSTKEKIKPEGLKKTRLVHKGDFILSNSMSFGRPYILDIDGCIHDGWLVIHDENKVFDKIYLYYLLSSPNMYSEFKRLAVGGVVNNLNSQLVRNVSVAIPPLEEQSRIVVELDLLTGIIDKQNAQLKELDNLAQAIFYDMFGDPIENPKGWEVKKLESLGDLGRGVSKHRPRNAPELLGGTMPLIQTGDVANANYLIRDYNSTYSDLGVAQSKVWPKGTLCITIAATIGKCAILDFEACFPDSVVGFTPNISVDRTYIYFIFCNMQKMLEDFAPGVAQKNINLAILNSLLIPVPPLSLQQSFAEKIQSIEKQKETIRASIADTQKLLDYTMDKYFG
ncbi:MAG: restriction endonuclease subunit S [Fibrobacter sp.]|nr:restriction endonuclease subunit S [Fibrobacter sp.]